MYFDGLAGLSCSAGAGAAAGAGTTALRAAAWEDRTPKYLTKFLFGGGTKAASRAMKASGSRSTQAVPLRG
jgi:hypothetical protein